MFKYILPLFFSTMTIAQEWQDKPVLCGNKKELLKSLSEHNQDKVYQATQITKVKDDEGYSDTPALIPVSIYMNKEKGTYSVVEYHPSYKQYCVISYGMNGKFVNK